MKKISMLVSLCVTLVMLFSLSGCEPQDSEKQTGDVNQEDTVAEDNVITANYDKQPEWSFLRGDLSSNVISSPIHDDRENEISADLFNHEYKAVIKFAPFQCYDTEECPDCATPVMFWNTMDIPLEAYEELDEETKEYYFGEDGIHVQEGCTMQVALADLDLDGSDEIIVAVHDGVIDGIFSVLKVKNYLELGEGEKVMALDVENLGTAWFQSEIVVSKKGHLICGYGSQGLYTEYALIDGKIQEMDTTAGE